MRRGLCSLPAIALAMLAFTWAGTSTRAQDKDAPKKDDPAKVDPPKKDDPAKVDPPKSDSLVADLKKQLDALAADAKTSAEKLEDLQTKLAAAETAAKKAEADAAIAAKAADKKIADAATELGKSSSKLQGEIDALKKAMEPKTEVDPNIAKMDEFKTSIDTTTTAAGDAKNSADIAWILVSTALVLLMLPGLALFYGGMVRKKNVLSTMMHSMGACAVVGTVWIAYGYGLAFGESAIKVDLLGQTDAGIVGWDWKFFFFKGIEANAMMPNLTIPVYLHAMFQGMFAIITGALISGAWAERIRFWPFCIFLVLWTTFVYCPLAHMVWSMDFFTPDATGSKMTGLLGKLGALDFAGGTVVHIAAGVAGLAGTFVIRKRMGYLKQPMHPNSMVLTLIGAGLLWVGWFGFNGGSSLNSSTLSVSAFAATQAAAAVAGLTWMVVEWILKGKPTALGLASGIVAGLVAVTPAAGFVYVWGGALIGLLAGIVCYFAVTFKPFLRYDDSLDAFGVHAVGGFLGAVLTGVLCYGSIQSASTDGFIAMNGLEPRIEAIKSVELPKAQKEAADAAPEAKEKAGKAVSDLESEMTNLTEKVEGYKKDDKGAMSQVIIQFKAAAFAAIYSLVLSLVLVALVQLMTLGNLRTSEKDEIEGLDRSEHGEVGFDYGVTGDAHGASLETVIRAAKVPPGTKRFSVVVEGVDNGGLMKAWSDMCKPTEGTPDADFVAIYPHVTTVQGNTFRFRSGDPAKISTHLLKLFQKKLGTPLKVRVED